MRHNDAGIALSAGLLFVGCALSSESFLSAYNLFNISPDRCVLRVGGAGSGGGAGRWGDELVRGGHWRLGDHYHWVLHSGVGFAGWLAALVALGIGCAGRVGSTESSSRDCRSILIIATLATLFVFTGLVHGFSEGYAYTDIPREFTFLGRQKFLGLSNLFWTMGLVLLATHYAFRHTVFGRRLLATGGIRRRLGWRGSIPTG